jgi:hypothetical protein
MWRIMYNRYVRLKKLPYLKVNGILEVYATLSAS